MSLFRDSWEVWRRKVDLAIGGGGDPIKSEDVTYDGTSSGLSATNVQSAIDEVAGEVSGLDGADVAYDNTDSGLSATNVQGAIDEVNAKPCQLATVTATPESSVTLETTTFTPVASVTIEAGTYLLLGHVRFGINNTGVRTINIGVSGWNGSMDIASAVPNALTTLNTWVIVTVTSTANYYLNAYQSSGGDLVADAIRLEAIKIK